MARRLLRSRSMETTRSLVRVCAAAALLLVVYAFAMASFAVFAMFGFGIVMGVPFWFGLPPVLGWAHQTAGSLAAPRRRVRADVKTVRLELATSS